MTIWVLRQGWPVLYFCHLHLIIGQKWFSSTILKMKWKTFLAPFWNTRTHCFLPSTSFKYGKKKCGENTKFYSVPVVKINRTMHKISNTTITTRTTLLNTIQHYNSSDTDNKALGLTIQLYSFNSTQHNETSDKEGQALVLTIQLYSFVVLGFFNILLHTCGLVLLVKTLKRCKGRPQHYYLINLSVTELLKVICSSKF